MLLRLLELLLVPLYLLFRCVEEVSGEGRWYRQQRRRMECERSPLSDADYVQAVGAEPGTERFWLAVRQAVADSIGVPAVAIHARDQLADLWRMQWVGPDLLDIVFRLERLLEVKISRNQLEPHIGGFWYKQSGEFHDFARCVVRGLSSATRGDPGTRV